MTIGPVPGAETLTRYLLAAGRRLDAAHRSFASIRSRLDAFDSTGPGPHTGLAIFEIVGDIETTVVALSRAIDMGRPVVSSTVNCLVLVGRERRAEVVRPHALSMFPL